MAPAALRIKGGAQAHGIRRASHAVAEVQAERIGVSRRSAALSGQRDRSHSSSMLPSADKEIDHIQSKACSMLSSADKDIERIQTKVCYMLSAEGKEIERIQSKVCSMLSAEGKGKDRIQSKVYSMLSAEGSGPPGKYLLSQKGAASPKVSIR